MKPVLAVLGPLALLVVSAAAGALLACGSSNQQTHDGTTVTIEKPADSTAAPSSPAPSK